MTQTETGSPVVLLFIVLSLLYHVVVRHMEIVVCLFSLKVSYTNNYFRWTINSLAPHFLGYSFMWLLWNLPPGQMLHITFLKLLRFFFPKLWERECSFSWTLHVITGFVVSGVFKHNSWLTMAANMVVSFFFWIEFLEKFKLLWVYFVVETTNVARSDSSDRSTPTRRASNERDNGLRDMSLFCSAFPV